VREYVEFLSENKAVPKFGLSHSTTQEKGWVYPILFLDTNELLQIRCWHILHFRL